MNRENKRYGIYIAPGRNPWPHELETAKTLALAEHYVEFLPEGSTKTADIRLDGVEFEIKAPESFNANTFEHMLKDALKQAPNIIIDTRRLKKVRDMKVQAFLVNQIRNHKHLGRIKRLIMITKQGKIVELTRIASEK